MNKIVRAGSTVSVLFWGVFTTASAAHAATPGIYPLTFGDQTTQLAAARGLTVAPDGTAYVAGWTTVGTANRASYWTLSPTGVVSAPNVLPTSTGGTAASQALGIGLLSNGTVVVAGNMAGGVSDWTSAPGQTNNGWVARYSSGTTQAVLGGQANQIGIAGDGASYYNVGRNASSAITGYSWGINGSTRADSRVSWGLGTNAATSSGVQGISAAGLAVGELRTPSSSVRRAYVADRNGVVTLLPGIAGRTDQFGQGYAISTDGNTAAGLTYWADGDTVQRAAYWTNSGGTWSSHKLGSVASSTSTAVAYGVNQDGSILVGKDFIAGRGDVSTFWAVGVLDVNGNPAGTLLKEWLTARGVDMSGWTELGRTYSAYTHGGLTYIVGDGTTAGTTPVTRGFIAVIPEPASLLLLAMALPLLRRNRR